MGHSVNSVVQPWYRQGWPWFLISLPASAVIGGIITIILAVHSPNALVVDDYYKEGLAINQHKRRLAVAEQLSINALLRSDGKRLSLGLSGSPPATEDGLQLQITHATRADLDQSYRLLRAADGNYVADLETALLPGTWYLRLRASDDSWEVRARMRIAEGPFQAYLTHED